MDRFLEPTLFALQKHDIDYRGVLYAGLMLTPDGPKLVEYNVRFGDPEAQVVLPRLTTDLGGLLAEASAGSLETTPRFGDDACVTVVVAVEGYPVSPRTGDRIEGIDAARAIEGVAVYCAGVAKDASGHLVTAGGRVLDITATGPTIHEARRRAYRAIEEIRFPGMQFRTDIAALAAEQEVKTG
jgi:phosphoribosylamine--glycine ligase